MRIASVLAKHIFNNTAGSPTVILSPAAEEVTIECTSLAVN
jgi:hypothetical protein